MTFAALLGRASGSPRADRRVAQALALLLAALMTVTGGHAPGATQSGGHGALCGPAALVSATLPKEALASVGDAIEGAAFCAHCLCGAPLTFKPVDGDGAPLSMAATGSGWRWRVPSTLAPEQRHRLARSPPNAPMGIPRAVAFL